MQLAKAGQPLVLLIRSLAVLTIGWISFFATVTRKSL